MRQSLILQPLHRFTYISAHSPTPSVVSPTWAHSPSFQSRHLRHSSFWFSKLSVPSPSSQHILQPFPRFTYVTAHYPTLPLLHLRHRSFSNPSFASPTSQDFHLLHLVPQRWTCAIELWNLWIMLCLETNLGRVVIDLRLPRSPATPAHNPKAIAWSYEEF